MAIFRSFPPFSRGYRMTFALCFFFFLLGLALGYGFWKENPEIAGELLKSVLDKFFQLSNQMQNVGWWGQAAIIFMNNLQVSVFMLLVGSILPFIPIMVVNSNGMIIGLFAAYFEQEGIISRSAFFLSLLPHGIFEITAILLAATVGIVWGFKNWLGWLNIRKSAGFIGNMKKSLAFFPWIVLLLLIAAVVEIIISPQILPTPSQEKITDLVFIVHRCFFC